MIRGTATVLGLLLIILAGACVSPPARTAARESPSSSPSPSPAPSPSPSPTPRPLSVTARPPAPAPAVRSRPSASPAPCAPSPAGGLTGTGAASQLVTVVATSSGSTTARVTLWERSGGCWTAAAGPWAGRLGAGGVSDHHREGDGSTPAGAFGIGPVMYGLAPDPGVHYRYHRLVCGDWWDEDPSSPTYNTFQHVACNASPPFHGKSEALWEATTAYQRFAVIGYNTSPVVPGAGSAVFLHDDTGRPTAGCLSLPAPALDRLLVWLDPRRSPLIVIGTEAWIRRS